MAVGQRVGPGVGASTTRYGPPTPDVPARHTLVWSDFGSAFVAWLVSLTVLGARDYNDSAYAVAWAAAAAVVTVAMLTRERLYLGRSWGVRAVEVQRVGRAGVATAATMLAADALLTSPMTPFAGVLAIALTCVLVVTARSLLVVRAAPRSGRARRHRSLLVADDPVEAQRVLDLLRSRPRLGYAVIGLVSGNRPTADVRVPWIGTAADLPVLVGLTAATNVIVAGSSFDDDAFAPVLAKVQALDVHCHLATRPAGDAAPHVRVLPLTHRVSVPSATPPRLSSAQRAAKRAFDVVAGAALGVVALPIVAVAAALLRVTVGGPVLAHHCYIGPDGRAVDVLRLQTREVPDATAARAVASICQRLRIDELPQLLSVLAGTMSLVGPRPKPRRRGATHVDVRPGLIGLRHVEMVDYPQLGRHRRTDEFYIENWSVGLDLSIVATSASDVAWRTLRQLVRAHDSGPATV